MDEKQDHFNIVFDASNAETKEFVGVETKAFSKIKKYYSTRTVKKVTCKY